MRYSINWTRSAETDYLQIIDYLLQNWPVSVAENFIEITENRIQQIQIFPLSSAIIHERKKIRKCILTKHNSLYYRVAKNKIHILRIFDVRQDPLKLQF
ncbi:MAG: hypothetical protein BGO34_19260 [Bacteroidia bacterium 44-10]|mgnify:FL=1|nr:MAG: hypothetical protein BGO34_19260 [Bacteroidia bacterium 44-10]